MMRVLWFLHSTSLPGAPALRRHNFSSCSVALQQTSIWTTAIGMEKHENTNSVIEATLNAPGMLGGGAVGSKRGEARRAAAAAAVEAAGENMCSWAPQGLKVGLLRAPAVCRVINLRPIRMPHCSFMRAVEGYGGCEFRLCASHTAHASVRLEANVSGWHLAARQMTTYKACCNWRPEHGCF